MTLARIRDIRRHELLQAAYEILKREGFQATTIDKIALEAGAAKGIVHHYFPNKRELILAALRYAHGLAGLCAVLDRRSVTNMTVALRHLVPPSEVETVGLSIMAVMDGCYLLASDEPQITRSVALKLIASHIRIIIPNFDESAVKLGSLD
jgi:AcrR family transcriptional regulator